ncbi:MAG: hypothetical protein V3R89_02785 [Thermoanaerobaculia bacterium]
MSQESAFRYAVYAYSSFHLMGDAEKYLVGDLGDCASAVAVCRKLVDDFLQSIQESANSPETLLAEYETSGPEPYIDSDDPTCWFSAAHYVRQRIREISR